MRKLIPYLPHQFTLSRLPVGDQPHCMTSGDTCRKGAQRCVEAVRQLPTAVIQYEKCVDDGPEQIIEERSGRQCSTTRGLLVELTKELNKTHQMRMCLFKRPSMPNIAGNLLVFVGHRNPIPPHRTSWQLRLQNAPISHLKPQHLNANPLKNLAIPEGLEPPTPCLEGRLL